MNDEMSNFEPDDSTAGFEGLESELESELESRPSESKMEPLNYEAEMMEDCENEEKIVDSLNCNENLVLDENMDRNKENVISEDPPKIDKSISEDGSFLIDEVADESMTERIDSLSYVGNDCEVSLKVKFTVFSCIRKCFLHVLHLRYILYKISSIIFYFKDTKIRFKTYL